MDKYIKVPLSDEDARSLKAGDYVYLNYIHCPGCGAQENAGSPGAGRSIADGDEE